MPSMAHVPQVRPPWYRRTNAEIYKNYEDDVIKFIKSRITFARHICHLDTTSSTCNIFKHKPMGISTRGRPSLRWLDFFNYR
ncbi:hypothetical protein TNCV_2665951 [Trichonephila clavipes]|nr:hypothetical protein TNCV_2665951 [Trichonephila clavipes]